MKKTSFLLFISICLSGCLKKVTSEGVVYSKHGYIMPNIKVSISEFGPTFNSTPYKNYTTTTDDNGHFRFNFLASKNRAYGFSILCDSGYCYDGMASGFRMSREKIKHIDLNLYK